MPPIVIAGGIAAAGAIGGAVLGNSAQKKANSQAAQTQNNATNAQLQLGHESLGLNKDIYNSNYNTLSPWVSRGNVAGNAYSDMLGLPSAPAMNSPLASPSAAPNAPSTGGQPSPGAPMNAYGTLPGGQPNLGANHNALMSQQPMPGAQPPAAAPGAMPGAAPAAQPPAQGAPPGASNAFNNFANSAGMQFQLQQGTNALNNMYAGRGMLQSGAAMKGIENYGQQTALNNYFMPYMNMLNGVSGQGLTAGSAIAGVGQNFGNTAANINSGMGDAINSGAQNIGNLQMANGKNQSNMYGQIGGALGRFGSSFMPTPQY